MDSFTDKCSDCCYEYYKSQLYLYNGKLICESCIPEDHQSCDWCGEVFNQKEMFSDKCKSCNLKHIKNIQDFYK